MTLSAPTRLDALRGFGPAPAATVIPFPSTQVAHAKHILAVAFTSPDGRTWHAVGGGDTLAAAIDFAQDSCPADTTWQPISRTDLYGD
jgi:hypothetical protein